MRYFSLPRARLEVENRLSDTRIMRLSSAAVRMLTRIWLALLEMTSPETTEISPTRRVSTFFTMEVTVHMCVEKVLRRPCTCFTACWRAELRSLTVLEKRESERAACLARAS